jgi:Tetratricopeptide repeat
MRVHELNQSHPNQIMCNVLTFNQICMKYELFFQFGLMKFHSRLFVCYFKKYWNLHTSSCINHCAESNCYISLQGHYRRGVAYLAMGKFKEALKDFQQVVLFMCFNKKIVILAVLIGLCVVLKYKYYIFSFRSSIFKSPSKLLALIMVVN